MQRIRSGINLFVVLSAAWALALPMAAWARRSEPAGGAAWLASTTVYLAGAVVCHQRPERSFHLGTEPLPVCARCSGIYGGAAAAAVVMLLGMRRARARTDPSVPSTDASLVRTIAMLAVAPTAVTLVWEWTTGDVPSNIIRACAGLPIGVFVSWIVMRSARPDRHSEYTIAGASQRN